jgi:hypothetical protein
MESWEAALEAERLKLSSAETVYAWLSELKPPESRVQENLPDVIFDTLATRNELLINIGLARFASSFEKVESLWSRGPAVRLAMLSNRNSGAIFPVADIYRVVAECTDDELGAMLMNPKTSPHLLARVFSNELKLTPERWQQACIYAIRNERLTYLPKHDTWEEFTDSRDHAKPINEVWNLFLRAEPTPQWANILQRAGDLAFDTTMPQEFLPERGGDPEQWAEAWTKRHEEFQAVLLKTISEKWKTSVGAKDETLTAHFWARAAFAASVSRTASHLAIAKGMEDHPDLAFRVGFYGGAKVLPGWPVRKYYDRDGREFIDGVLSNDSLYERRNHAEQAFLKRLAYDHEECDCYRRNLARLLKKDPVRYGDEPTDEMREAVLKREAKEARKEALKLEREEREAKRVDAGKPPPKPCWWKRAAMWVFGGLFVIGWLVTR